MIMLIEKCSSPRWMYPFMRGFIITNCPPPEINMRIVAAIQIATVMPIVLATSFILLSIHLYLHDKYTRIMPDKKMFQKLNEVFALVHLHGNNFKYDLVNNIPYFFECTYINKKYLTKSLEFNTDTIPSTLDQPNLVSKPDVFLNFEPYVHNNIRLPRTLKLGPKGFY
mgnify:CR=1 FL=1